MPQASAMLVFLSFIKNPQQHRDKLIFTIGNLARMMYVYMDYAWLYSTVILHNIICANFDMRQWDHVYKSFSSQIDTTAICGPFSMLRWSAIVHYILLVFWAETKMPWPLKWSKKGFFQERELLSSISKRNICPRLRRSIRYIVFCLWLTKSRYAKSQRYCTLSLTNLCFAEHSEPITMKIYLIDISLAFIQINMRPFKKIVWTYRSYHSDYLVTANNSLRYIRGVDEIA